MVYDEIINLPKGKQMAVVWRSEITAEMVSDLTPEQIQQLVDCLDEAVMIVASDFGVE